MYVLKARQPDYPIADWGPDLAPISSLILVTVDLSGKAIGAAIYKTSRNDAMDQSALKAASNSSYSPKLVSCQAVQGQYLFRADFRPQ